MEATEIREKRPWRRIIPDGYMGCALRSAQSDNTDTPSGITVTQADFIREYYPTSHAINSPVFHPDIFREETYTDADGREQRRIYKEEVPRKAYAFQQIITTKRLTHLCGNDIRFELNSPGPTKAEEGMFASFRTGWLDKDMEIAFHDFVRSVFITADAAFIGWLDGGTFGWDVWSFGKGSRIYPHFDMFGKLILIARECSGCEGTAGGRKGFIEAYDDDYHYILTPDPVHTAEIETRTGRTFRASGYAVAERSRHGFPFCPAAYHRSESGPCWSFSQETCDSYELASSQMAHNNMAYGEPILKLQSEGESLDIAHGVNGTIKMLSMGHGDSAEYLQGQSASESFMREIDTDHARIYEQSFAVLPPELKSGDLPAAALKILYSPAVEKAMEEANEYHRPLRRMVEIFRYGYGVETGDTIGLASLPVKFWIEPYVHLNTSATVSELSMAVQNRFLSRKTASEVASFYTTGSEWERLAREEKEQQEAELIYEKAAAAAEGTAEEADGQ